MCVCYNSQALSWEEAILALEHAQQTCPFSYGSLMRLCEVLENELALSGEDVQDILKNSDINKIIEQTALILPVLWLRQGQKAMAINLNEMVIDGEVIENLLALEMHSDNASTSDLSEHELRSSLSASTDASACNKVQKKRGPSFFS